MSKFYTILLLILILFLAIFYSLTSGTYDISLLDLWHLLIGQTNNA